MSKDGSLEVNMIGDNKMEHDPCAPTDNTRSDRKIDERDEALDDNMSNDLQTHRTVSRDP